MLSLLAKKPTRRPMSGNVVALELFEEAERAHRLWRINPEVRRSGSSGLADLPPLRTLTIGGQSGELDPASLAEHFDDGTVTPRPAEPLDCELPRMSGTTGSWPSSLRDLLQSFRSSRRPNPGASDHPVARQMLTETMAAPFAITPEERYLCGHYLAYLLGGARRRGILLRRPNEARNADRARYLLAMAWLSCAGRPTRRSSAPVHCLTNAPTFAPRFPRSW